MKLKMKYIMFERNIPVIFSELFSHKDIAYILAKIPVSAGFIKIVNGILITYGESISLDLLSNPDDAVIVKRYMECEE